MSFADKFFLQVDFPEGSYRTYLAMETHILSRTVRGLSTTVQGLQASLDNALSLLIHMHHDLEQYLDHNPCWICLLMELRNEFTVRQVNGGVEGASIPAPPISPPLSVHEFLDQLEAEWKASLLPPLGASPPSFITPPWAPVSTLEMRQVLLIILGMCLLNLDICWLSSLSLGEAPQNILIPWVMPPPIEFPLLFPQLLTPPYQTDSPPYIPMSLEYCLGPLALPPLSPLMGHPLLKSPLITLPLDLSLEDIQLPPLCTLSANQVKRKSVSKKRNAHQHLKKVFKDYLKEFSPEVMEEEVMEQLGHSLKGRHSSGPCKRCAGGGWYNVLHHCYTELQESGGV